MTSDILKKWFVSWDVELQQKPRKILFVLDDCAAHPHLDFLKNIQLEFLSPNTTSLVQPRDIVIIKNLKALYCTKLVNYILEAIQKHLLASSSAAKEVSARTDLLQAMQFTVNSWQTVSTEIIQNSFAHCGFKHSELEMQNKANSENDTILEMHHVSNYEEFSCINNSLQCYNENKDCEEEIVEQIVAKHQKTPEDQENDENDMTEHEQATNQDTTKSHLSL
jgi:hypothetical protein